MSSSSSTGLIMTAIVVSAWLAVLLASAATQPADEGYSISYGSWPEVVGMSSEEAKKKICGDRSSCAHVHVIPPGYAVTMDYRGWSRVRIFVDSNDKVVRVPRIG